MPELPIGKYPASVQMKPDPRRFSAELLYPYCVTLIVISSFVAAFAARLFVRSLHPTHRWIVSECESA